MDSTGKVRKRGRTDEGQRKRQTKGARVRENWEELLGDAAIDVSAPKTV